MFWFHCSFQAYNLCLDTLNYWIVHFHPAIPLPRNYSLFIFALISLSSQGSENSIFPSKIRQFKIAIFISLCAVICQQLIFFSFFVLLNSLLVHGCYMPYLKFITEIMKPSLYVANKWVLLRSTHCYFNKTIFEILDHLIQLLRGDLILSFFLKPSALLLPVNKYSHIFTSLYTGPIFQCITCISYFACLA